MVPEQGALLRREVFERVERTFLQGLRARSPATRAKFFDLYDKVRF